MQQLGNDIVSSLKANHGRLLFKNGKTFHICGNKVILEEAWQRKLMASREFVKAKKANLDLEYIED